MTIIAFDVSKAELVGARMRISGIVAERYTIVNTPERIEEFLDTITQKKISIGSEATAEYHLHLARACLARGIPFRLINPIVTKQFTRATIRKRKTDRDDAEIIGRCLLQGAGRLLTEHDLQPSTRILRTASDLSHMARTLRRKQQRFAEHFPDLLSVQTALAEASDAVRRCAQRLHEEGTDLVSSSERSLVESIVGIGEELSPVIVSEIGDALRFKGGKQLVAYAGLDPKVKQSGKVLARNTSITKRGSPYLRRALFIAASVAQRYDPELKAYYEKKRAEGKRYTEVTVANARHMAHRILAVMKRGTPYVKRQLSTAQN